MANKHNIYVDGIYSNENGDDNIENIEIGDILEYKSAYVLADFPDNGIIPKRVLMEAIDGITVGNAFTFLIEAGSAIPYTYSLIATPFANGFIAIVKLKLTDTKNRVIYDVPIDENTDPDTELLSSIDIFGHDSGDGATTIDDLYITLYPL